MLKCKKCNRRVPHYHKDDYDLRKGLCKKCYIIENSKYKDLKNVGKSEYLEKEE